jgi:peptide/nickel transport system permease protein
VTEVALALVLKERRRWRRPPATLIVGASILFVIVGLAVFAPFDTSYNPTTLDLTHILSGPSAAHWLGTDQLGRTILGAFAGYRGGWLDSIIMRIADVVVAFPFYVLVILLVFLLGPGVRSIYIAISIVSWISYARIIRGATLVAKTQEYVLAAQIQGFSTFRIILRHVLPNTISQAIVFAMSDVVNDILAIVTLGFLGLGIPPPAPDWGEMMASGQQFLTTHWELSTIPGIAVVITGLGLSLIGDGLNELLGRN